MTPLEITLERSSEPLELELHAEGFKTTRRTVVPDGDKTLSVDLATARAVVTPRAAAAAPRAGAAKTVAAPRASSPALW
jgi:hypothetical protein